jgi:putative peptidoglycan lipid II flippase
MSEERRVARHAGTVGAATMLSRILGLVREQVMASWFGAGFATDAFNVAFRIPNLLRDLFAEGAMSSAFVPTFTEYRHREGNESAWGLGRRLLVSLFALLMVVCAIGYVAAPLLVRAFAPGFAAISGKLELTVLLTRIMLPFLPLVAVAAACSGMLNARGHFAAPALAPSFLNLGMVICGLALIPVCARLGQPAIVAMAVGVVIGGLGQFLCQLPPLFRLGFRWRWEWPVWHPGVKHVAWLMVPATVGLAATQFNLFFSTLIASLLEQGSVSWLWYAFRIMQLPIGVFGVALATVSLPALSRAAVESNMDALKTTLSASLRLVFLLTIPAALWLAVMAHPVITLLYEHGRFGPLDSARTAQALVMYCIGLPAFAAVGILTRTFYALGDTRTPVQASFVSVGLNVALNLALMRPLGHMGLALATSLTSIVNLVQLVFYLRRRIGPFEGRRIATSAVRVTAAAVLVAVVCRGVSSWLARSWGPSLMLEIATIAVSFLIAIVVGYAALKALRVEEVDVAEQLMRSLRSRLRKG